ncbi:MAG: argininosuccinate synthase [Gammaproteobacteria bacterium]|nr:argininosuccinate synthase [Gammaproteobacteria bacterium]
MSNISKIVLAYSGGLDTSIILKWLQEEYNAEVYAFIADVGQGEELEPAAAKAKMLGAADVFVEDLREMFVRDFVFPMFRANTIYEGEYLLGTSIARPLIAQYLLKAADAVGADAIAHGATGKGNDQVRFELSAYALKPDIRIIAPWRQWQFNSRSALLKYAEQHDIPIDATTGGEAPYSIDANLLHTSYEGGILEDPWCEPEPTMWQRTADLAATPDTPQTITLDFEKGDPCAIDGESLAPSALLMRLNEVAGKHGIGRIDLVENRYVGMKSRGCYETPGGTLLLKAHRAMESLTLDRQLAHLKDELMPRYAELIYNGYWWSEERKALQQLIDYSQSNVTGAVRLKLCKANVEIVGRQSPNSLFDSTMASFEDDHGVYDPRDAEGFIKLNALRLRKSAAVRN